LNRFAGSKQCKKKRSRPNLPPQKKTDVHKAKKAEERVDEQDRHDNPDARQ